MVMRLRDSKRAGLQCTKRGRRWNMSGKWALCLCAEVEPTQRDDSWIYEVHLYCSFEAPNYAEEMVDI
ncbi:unnamed protein product [Nippostrongylus brasiliensis]|uniref:MATH domain-containing protein n=1 Tax=Nippostrongylus brasiliensis TaxID=27835 RepID=A0A0N4XHU5_NIPBR|nr:unnamed protein product [Nippostrongylus brasiliensis]